MDCIDICWDSLSIIGPVKTVYTTYSIFVRGPTLAGRGLLPAPDVVGSGLGRRCQFFEDGGTDGPEIFGVVRCEAGINLPHGHKQADT